MIVVNNKGTIVFAELMAEVVDLFSENRQPLELPQVNQLKFYRDHPADMADLVDLTSSILNTADSSQSISSDHVDLPGGTLTSQSGV